MPSFGKAQTWHGLQKVIFPSWKPPQNFGAAQRGWSYWVTAQVNMDGRRKESAN